MIFCAHVKLQGRKYRGPHWDSSNTLAITARKWAPGKKRKTHQMLSAAYDILRKDATDMVWVEAVHDLETAKSRVQELAAGSDEEYVIFDQRTRKIVANGTSL